MTDDTKDEQAEKEGAAPKAALGLDFIGDVDLLCTVEFGRSEVTVRSFLSWKKGSVVELDKEQGSSLEVLANNSVIARGEAVIVNDKFGVRITEVTSSRPLEDF